MQAVSAALDLLFTDPNLALDAWHRDVAGQFTKLRIIQCHRVWCGAALVRNLPL